MGVQQARAAVLPAQPVEQFFQVSLFGLLASGFLALAFSEFLDWPTAVLTGLGLLIRAVAVFGRRPDWSLSPGIANALTITYIGFYPLDTLYLSREFIPATVHLICFLAVVRVLSAQSNRDYFFVKVLAFLMLLAATLLSSGISFFFFLTTFLIFGVATFCCSEIRRSSQQPRRIVLPRSNFHGRLALLTGAVTLGIVLMTSGLFVVLPRTARAAFRSLVPDKYHITGFANEITLGQIGRIQQSSTPLIHIRVDESARRLPLKWRGGALSQFDGRRWHNPPAQNQMIRVEKGLALLANDDQRRRAGKRIAYQVRIDSIEADALFFTGIPEFVNINLPVLFRTPQNTYRTGEFGAASSYYATSFQPDTDSKEFSMPPLPEVVAREYMRLPPIDPRIVQLVGRLDPGGAAAERARAFENYLRTNFNYTTELLDEEVPDPLAHFLFERKAGHCEYFASAMAVMLRIARIPSRVATGFQSGVYNPMTQWHVLRASDAHSWVEAWAPGEGWLTFDPTPPALSPAGQPWTYWALYIDAAQMWWRRWVVDYDLEHQLYLASRFEQSTRNLNRFSSEGWSKRAQAQFTVLKGFATKVAPVAGLILIVTAIAWVLLPKLIDTIRQWLHARRIRRGAAAASDAAILYSRMLSELRRRGYEKPAWLTPTEFARVLPESPTADLVKEFTKSYMDLRYGSQTSAAEHMLGLLEAIQAVPARLRTGNR